MTDTKKGDIMKTKIFHRRLSLGLTLMMVFSLTSTAWASPVVTPHKQVVSNLLDTDFNFSGYLWYTNNSSESLTVDRMGAMITNNGNGPHNTADMTYLAWDGNGYGLNPSIGRGGDYFHDGVDVAPGHKYLYHTPPWIQLVPFAGSSTYYKYGKYATFHIGLGAYEEGHGTVGINAYPTYFQTYVIGERASAPISMDANISNSKKLSFTTATVSNRTISESYNLNSTRSTESPMVIESKPPRIVQVADGTESTMLLTSFSNGTATYALADNVDLNQAEIITPVLYFERSVPQTIIPLSDNGPILSVKTSKTYGKANIEDGHLVIDFTAANVEQVPYDLVLVSDGKIYDNCSIGYDFDMETGNFTSGRLVFYDLMFNDLSADAYLTTSSMFEQYRPDTFIMDR